MNCPNCNSTLSCGCQKRTLADGTPGCTKCANAQKRKNLITTTLKKAVIKITPDNTII